MHEAVFVRFDVIFGFLLGKVVLIIRGSAEHALALAQWFVRASTILRKFFASARRRTCGASGSFNLAECFTLYRNSSQPRNVHDINPRGTSARSLSSWHDQVSRRLDCRVG